MKTFRLLIITLATAALGMGCEEERAPAAPAPTAKKAAAGGGAAAPTAQAASATPFVYAYNPVGKRDPFRSPVAEIRPNDTPGQSSCTEPLCVYDLDQLTLVAVVTGDANPIAMVEDPQGRGFIVRRNARMGKQGGKVTNILRDSVTVTEFFTDQTGRVNANPVNLKLKSDVLLGAPAMDLTTGQIIQ
ncbi:MAG TPA: pilus assembly protein PilP [Myxococcaceae bacterium]|nr:pilus assembly protein PilP [Myxococcaceae bacterium]